MQDAFETAGVWEQLTKNIEVWKYTHAGDPLKIDCGYQPNGIIRLFHAVSLASEPDSAKILAFTYPTLAEGVAKVKGAKTDFTAIVENEINRENEAVRFAIETLEHSSIHVSPVSELPALAERARVELRM
jgi:hypothetical protein